jgi:hypothetical protein
MKDLLSRVEILERQVKIWRRVVALLSSGIVVVAVVGAAQNVVRDQVVGSRFVLRSDKKDLADLYTNIDGQPILALRQATAGGRMVDRLVMSVDKEGMPWMVLEDENARPLFSVDTLSGHTTRLRIQNPKGSPQTMELSVGKEGAQIFVDEGDKKHVIYKKP